MNRIKIVQGDSVDTVITLEGDGVETVIGVDFICPALNASYYLEATSDVITVSTESPWTIFILFMKIPPY